MNGILTRPWIRSLTLVCLAALLACSGGGGGGMTGVAPTITAQPAATTVTLGGAASFLVVVDGTPAPSIQWDRSPDGATWSAVPGATGGSLAFTPAKADNAAQYRARATNATGSASSNPAALTVQWAPSFSAQPADQVVNAPDPAVFTMGMDCNPDATSQWQSSSDGLAWSDLPGATGATYSTGPTSSAMNNMQFRCTCTNMLGSTTTSAATLTVDGPVFTLTVDLGAGTTGTPAAGGPIPAGSTVAYTYSAMAGYTSLQVLLDGAAVAASGSFTMDGAHALAVSATPPATFTIQASAGLYGSITPSGAVAVPAGGNQTFTITADSYYAIAEVQVDGVSVGVVGTYTFTNVTGGHTIHATFM